MREVKHHRFRSLPKNRWSARGWYDETGPLPKAPRGWRWLNLGEYTTVGDLCCDPRSDPVVNVCGGTKIGDRAFHPVLRKLTVKKEPKRKEKYERDTHPGSNPEPHPDM